MSRNTKPILMGWTRFFRKDFGMKKTTKFFMAIIAFFIFGGCGVGFAPSALDPYFHTILTETTPYSQALPQTPISPTPGGTLRLSMPLPRTLNPLLNSDPYVAQILKLIFEPVVIFDNEKRPVPNPAIIQNIVFAPSGQTVNITLHENIFWEDGVAITSADIAFSIDVLRNHAPQTAVYHQNATFIASHDIIDTQTIHLTLNAPMWRMMYYFDFPIIPAHYYTGVPMSNLAHARNMHPVGNGAFRFYSHTTASRLELIASAYAPGGRAYIDQVTVAILRNFDDALHSFEQGVSDAFVGYVSQLGRFHSLGKNMVGTSFGHEFDFVGFNNSSLFFNDLAMRSAISAFLPANQLPIHPNTWLATDTPPLDPASFAELGFTLGEHDILERRPAPGLSFAPFAITVIVNEENSRAVNTANNLHEQLTAQGVAVSLYTLSHADFLARLNAGTFDLMIGSIDLGFKPSLEFLRNYSFLGFNSSNFNRLLDDINLATNESAFVYAMHRAQEYIAYNLPIIGLGFAELGFFVGPRIHGNFSPSGHSFFVGTSSWFIH